MTITSGPSNLIAGKNLIIPPPNISAIYYSTVAIYNPTTYQCTVHIAQNQDFIQAQMASLFYIPTQGNLPILSPITNITPGSYVGTVSSVFYAPSDYAPTSFPLPLTVSALASTLLLNGLVMGDQSGDLTSIIIQPASGTLSLTFDFGVLAGNAVTFSVDGIQSAHHYFSITPFSNQMNAIGPLTGATDTSYTITASVPLTGGTMPITQLFQNPF